MLRYVRTGRGRDGGSGRASRLGVAASAILALAMMVPAAAGARIAASGGVIALPILPGGSSGSSGSTNTWLDFSHLALMNYKPGANGPNPLSQNPIDTAKLDSDLSRIASLNANVVRLVVPYDLQNNNSTYPIETFLEEATKYSLRTQLTLFDGYSGYTNLMQSEQWAQKVVGPFAGDRRVAFLELQNEIDPTNSSAMTWARTMIPYLRNIAEGIPVTVSVGGWCAAATQLATLKQNLGNHPPDFWDVHYYCNPAAAYKILSNSAGIASPRHLIVGETGYTTDTSDTTREGATYGTAWQEAEQGVFYRAVDAAAHAAGLPPAAPWIDSDIAPDQCPSCPTTELHFGLFRLVGTAKPARAVVAAAFAAVQPLDNNLGFEEDAGGYPVAWGIDAADSATFVHDNSVAHSGVWSARITNSTYSGSGPVAAWALDYPSPITPYHTYTASAWVRGLAVDGATYVGIVWTTSSGSGLYNTHSDLLPLGDASQWQQLTVSAAAPPRAAYAQIILTSRSTGSVWFDDVHFSG